MEMKPVSSTVITAVGYDTVSKRMRIRFTHGRSYDFCDVPEHIHDGLVHSGSKDRYYNVQIKDKYKCS